MSITGDDLITPVYVPPTRPPTTTPKDPVKIPSKPCDDEDCFPGSGSGEVTTDEVTTSKGENKMFAIYDNNKIQFKIKCS